MGATFWQDLDESNKKENELKRILEQQGYTVTTSQGKDVFSDYDLKVTNESGRSCLSPLKDWTKFVNQISHSKFSNYVEEKKTV